MLGSTPLVSIITATFNAELCLENSIKSVIAQSYPNYEYIIIDGGSQDNTIDILKKYNNILTYWISEPDSGIYDAWNKGLKKASGDWIVFIGADDQLVPNALETYINYINSNPAITFDFVSSLVRRTHENGIVEGEVGKAWVWKQFKYRMTTAHPGSFHSKRLFERYGNYNTSYKIVSDYELLLRPGNSLIAGFIDKVTAIMSTGGKFNRKTATQECLKMIHEKKQLGYFQYIYFKYKTLAWLYLQPLYAPKR